MAESNVRAMIDQARQRTAEANKKLAEAGAAATSTANPLGLRFPAGARVLDLTTGQQGTVESGARDPRSGDVIVRVALADGRPVYRTERELEAPPAFGGASRP